MIDLLAQIVGAPVGLEELKSRPGRRRTLRACGPEGRAIVKVYASDRAADVAAAIAVLADGPPEPIVPDVLRLSRGLHLVVLSEVPGRSLREVLLEGDLGVCSRVGTALGGWHAAWTDVAPTPLRRHTIERELEILRRRSVAASPSVSHAVHEALPGLAGEWRCGTVVHRDLYEEQVVVGQRVGLIDLDDVALGPPELDLGNLVAHVELLERRVGRDLALEVGALLDGYKRSGPAVDRRLLERCRALTLLRLACLNDDPSLAASASAREVPG